jgi:predicted metalloprotease with PDZ domain
VILQDSGSGMEGLFSFYMANWSYAELFYTFRPVIAHEALHAWIGIRTGDLDDPWWKEGTASYLGRVLGANIGSPKDSLRPQLVKDLSANPMVNGKAMSDPYVRRYLYDRDPDVNCLVLVYDKGAQACMILDKMIRLATNNASTLFSKTGNLCTRYDHSAFSRSQFKALLEENTSLDFSGFFDTYIDRAGAIDTAVLSGAWHFLDSCGAFSTKP